MKKLFTLVVVVLMVVGAKAQTEIVVGPKVGLNMTIFRIPIRKIN